jgi:transcriptional regulator with XRE-family HTH domain
MTTTKVFGPAIKYIRKDRGVSQDALAVAIEISPSHLHRVETGERKLATKFVPLIAAHLNVDESEFTYQVNAIYLGEAA